MSTLFIGLMSGTSLDGVDAVLADFASLRPRVMAHAHHAFATELRRELTLLATPGWDDLNRAAIAAQHLARAYAGVVEDLLIHSEIEANAVRAIGVHGQTVRHRPDAGYTVQLNAPAALAELTEIDVVADFRSRDIAAGGQGAPLVPALHAAIFTTAAPRAVVNIGGVSNLTGLPEASSTVDAIGFDCGPGNLLIDAWAQEHLGEPIDRDGHWAARGQTDAALLAALLAEPFFAQPPPRSTGRELFNLDWFSGKLAGRSIEPQNVQATLTRLSAAAIGRSIRDYFPRAADVIVCGGGAYNATMIKMLAQECAPRPVVISSELGIAPEQVEALAFAWLAHAHLERRTGNLPTVTGARGRRVLGALYPA